MSLEAMMRELMAESPYLPTVELAATTAELMEEDRLEVLAFLAERPTHTVCIASFIRDNGLISPLNRGTFYGCRNSEGRLEGVALIGHATLLEARTTRAMREFGLIAQTHQRKHMILGEKHSIEL